LLTAPLVATVKGMQVLSHGDTCTFSINK
jgi:hypothetical protein